MKNFTKITTCLLIALTLGAMVMSCKKDVEKVEVTPATLTIKVGATSQLTATVTPDKAEYTLAWTSSAPTVATVNAEGKVTAVAEGTATITVEAGGKTATCVVTVEKDGPFVPTVKTFIEDVEGHPSFTINSTVHGWSYIDNDGSSTYAFQSVSFSNAGEPMSYIVFSPSETTPALTFEAHSGNKMFACFASTPPANDDYLITPELQNPTSISFWATTYTGQYGLERMKVLYSTTGRNISDFTNKLNSGNYIQVPEGWTQYTYELPIEAKYVAIQCVSDDAFIFFVDDIEITASAAGSLPEKTAKGVQYNNFVKKPPVAKVKK
ncbi:MAG: choice-of-anchor J domain-containing protein [Bacteroidales bacterium]|jgi:hypothetical protein|nr:choice-of-anchor J domain-containing protein [Bacteroidales bacterium]